MLRIKDSVDLKELEKFGFKKNEVVYENIHTWFPLGDSIPCYKTSITVSIKDRYIYVYIEEVTWRGEKSYHKFEFQDELYDLITAGLVEKVD